MNSTDQQKPVTYQDPPVGVPCLEAERPVVWGSSARTPRKRRVLVYSFLLFFQVFLRYGLSLIGPGWDPELFVVFRSSRTRLDLWTTSNTCCEVGPGRHSEPVG